MRRAFTLQLYPQPPPWIPHKHICLKCKVEHWCKDEPWCTGYVRHRPHEHNCTGAVKWLPSTGSIWDDFAIMVKRLQAAGGHATMGKGTMGTFTMTPSARAQPPLVVTMPQVPSTVGTKALMQRWLDDDPIASAAVQQRRQAVANGRRMGKTAMASGYAAAMGIDHAKKGPIINVPPPRMGKIPGSYMTTGSYTLPSPIADAVDIGIGLKTSKTFLHEGIVDAIDKSANGVQAFVDKDIVTIIQNRITKPFGDTFVLGGLEMDVPQPKRKKTKPFGRQDRGTYLRNAFAAMPKRRR